MHPFDFGDPVGAVPSAAELRYPNGVLRTSILAYGWDIGGELAAAIIVAPEGVFVWGGPIYVRY